MCMCVSRKGMYRFEIIKFTIVTIRYIPMTEIKIKMGTSPNSTRGNLMPVSKYDAWFEEIGKYRFVSSCRTT